MTTMSPPLWSQPFISTSLIGREHDIDAISSLLRSRARSILTLTGPAGVGKTRLAIAVAHAMASEFPHGFVYVDLTPLSDTGDVLPAILYALGLPDGEQTIDRLGQHLSTRSLLLDRAAGTIGRSQRNRLNATMPVRIANPKANIPMNTTVRCRSGAT